MKRNSLPSERSNGSQVPDQLETTCSNLVLHYQTGLLSSLPIPLSKDESFHPPPIRCETFQTNSNTIFYVYIPYKKTHDPQAACWGKYADLPNGGTPLLTEFN